MDHTLAKLAQRHGFFPCNADKSPDTGLGGDHNRFRRGIRPTEADVASWHGHMIGVWCGVTGLMLIDVDVAGAFAPYLKAVEEAGLGSVLEKCAIVETAHGYHIWCLVPGCTEGNRKLAKRSEPEYSLERDKTCDTIIETRGVGGYGIIPPSPCYRYEGARTLLDLEALTLDEWGDLCNIARSFDESKPEKIESGPKSRSTSSGVRPGDDYAKRGPSIVTMLEKAGWKSGRFSRSRWTLTRPGKTKGISGTVTGDGEVFYCFSSNAHPFEPDRAYSPFAVYALLNHNGDFAEAAKQLASDGYGEQSNRKTFEVIRAESKLPAIETNNVPLEVMVNEAIAALALYNAESPRLFVRSGAMVEVAFDEDQAAMVRMVDESRMTMILATCARFASTSEKRGSVHVVPPAAVVRSILSMASYEWLPPLAAIAQAPVLGPNGISLTQGYNPDSRVYIASGLAWHVARRQGRPAARWILDEVLPDFPFQSSADRANALALMLLPFVQPVVDGPTPLHLIDAPTQGTGKSLLATACAFPAVGRKVSAMAQPQAEEEWAKAILSLLQTSRQVVLIDNISHRVDSGAFANVLTSRSFEGRLLGSNTIGTYPVRCTWVGTSNNAQLSTDIARRTVSIRLDSGVEKPWQRGGFKHTNLLAWMHKNREEVVGNLLAMIDAWRLAGRPDWTGNPLGSFEDWSRIIGGILEVCGIEGFLANWEAMYESANFDEVAWAGLYARWYDRYGLDPVRAGDLYELAQMDDALMSLLGNGNEQSQKIRLGILVKRRVRRVCGGYVVEVDGKTHRALRFKIAPAMSVNESSPSTCNSIRSLFDGDVTNTPIERLSPTPNHSHTHPPPKSPQETAEEGPTAADEVFGAVPEERSLADRFIEAIGYDPEKEDGPHEE